MRRAVLSSTQGVGEGMSVVSKGMASKLHGRWGVTARKEALQSVDPQLQGEESASKLEI